MTTLRVKVDTSGYDAFSRDFASKIPAMEQEILADLGLRAEGTGKDRITTAPGGRGGRRGRVLHGHMRAGYRMRRRSGNIEVTSPVEYFVYQDLGTKGKGGGKGITPADVTLTVLQDLDKNAQRIAEKVVEKHLKGAGA